MRDVITPARSGLVGCAPCQRGLAGFLPGSSAIQTTQQWETIANRTVNQAQAAATAEAIQAQTAVPGDPNLTPAAISTSTAPAWVRAAVIGGLGVLVLGGLFYLVKRAG